MIKGKTKTFMKIGFTGTQKGMSENQISQFIKEMSNHYSYEFHHGDCIGSDRDAHNIASSLMNVEKIVIHPPDNSSKRAYCKGDEIKPEKPYLERNKDIVDEIDLLIACPKSNKEELRSGTWATIRYAKEQGKKIIIIYPDGERRNNGRKNESKQRKRK